MTKFCLSSLASPSDSLFFTSSSSPQVRATVTYKGTTATHPQAQFHPSNHSSVQKPSAAPTVLQIMPPTPRWWHWNKTLRSGWLAFSPGLPLPQPARLRLNPWCPMTWCIWSFSPPLPLPGNHASPSGLSLASCPKSAQSGSGLSWCAGSFLCFLPVSLFSQVSIHPRKILWIRDLGLFHLSSHYLHPMLIHQNVGVADCRGPPLCLTLQTEVWGWRGASRGVAGLAALWLLVEYVQDLRVRRLPSGASSIPNQQCVLRQVTSFSLSLCVVICHMGMFVIPQRLLSRSNAVMAVQWVLYTLRWGTPTCSPWGKSQLSAPALLKLSPVLLDWPPSNFPTHSQAQHR